MILTKLTLDKRHVYCHHKHSHRLPPYSHHDQCNNISIHSEHPLKTRYFTLYMRLIVCKCSLSCKTVNYKSTRSNCCCLPCGQTWPCTCADSFRNIATILNCKFNCLTEPEGGICLKAHAQAPESEDKTTRPSHLCSWPAGFLFHSQTKWIDVSQHLMLKGTTCYIQLEIKAM